MLITLNSSFVALFTLVLQNTAIVLSTKHSFRPSAGDYIPAVVVLLSELLKLCTCLVVIRLSSSWHSVFETLGDTSASIRLALPSLLYVVQNNAHFVAIKHLPLHIYICMAQAKVLTTALFSAVLLGKRLLPRQCIALLCLMLGLVLVQIHADERDDGMHNNEQRNHIYGMLAITLSTLISGFAGVYLEKLYKNKTNFLWELNLHLSILSLPFALIPCLFILDKPSYSFTAGIDVTVTLIILLKALGGIVVAYVVKFADSILKNFSVAVSICVCVIYSVYIGEQTLNALVISGMLCVLSSIFMYNSVTCSLGTLRRTMLNVGIVATAAGALALTFTKFGLARDSFMVVTENTQPSYPVASWQINNFSESPNVKDITNRPTVARPSHVHGPSRRGAGLSWYTYENIFVSGADHIRYIEGEKNGTFKTTLHDLHIPNVPTPYKSSQLKDNFFESTSHKLFLLRGLSILVGCWRRTSYDTNPAHYMMGMGKLYALLNDEIDPVHIDNVIFFQCLDVKKAGIKTDDIINASNGTDNFFKAVWRMVRNSGSQHGWFDDSTRFFSLGYDDIGPKSLMFLLESALIDHSVGRYLGGNQPRTINSWKRDFSRFMHSTSPSLWTSIEARQDLDGGNCFHKLRIGIFQRKTTSHLRRFINLDDVLSLARTLAGQVDIISFDKHSTINQVALLMNSYEIIITPHGSHLTNGLFAMFMPFIIEIVPMCWNNDFGGNLAGLSHYEISTGHNLKNASLGSLIRQCSQCKNYNENCTQNHAGQAIQSDLLVNLTILSNALTRAISAQCKA